MVFHFAQNGAKGSRSIKPFRVWTPDSPRNLHPATPPLALYRLATLGSLFFLRHRNSSDTLDVVLWQSCVVQISFPSCGAAFSHSYRCLRFFFQWITEVTIKISITRRDDVAEGLNGRLRGSCSAALEPSQAHRWGLEFAWPHTAQDKASGQKRWGPEAISSRETRTPKGPLSQKNENS